MEMVVDGSTPNIWQLQANEDIPGLIQALGDVDPGIRKRAAASLRILDATEAVPALKDALDIEDDWQAQAAMTAAVQYLSRGDRLLDLITQRNTDGLLAILLSGNEAEVMGAVRALGQIGDARSVEPLVSLFQAGTTSDDVRYVVAETLIELKSAPTIVSLVAGLRRDEWQVRRNSAAILGQLKATWAAPALADALRDIHPLVRRTAEAALRQLDTPAAREALLEWRELQAAAQRVEKPALPEAPPRKPEQVAAQRLVAALQTAKSPDAEPEPVQPASAQSSIAQSSSDDDDTSWVVNIEPPSAQAVPSAEAVPPAKAVQADEIPASDDDDTAWVENIEPAPVPEPAPVQQDDDDDDTSWVENVELPPVDLVSAAIPAGETKKPSDNTSSPDGSASWVENVDAAVSETPVLDFLSPDPAEDAPAASEEPSSGHDRPTLPSRPTALRHPAKPSDTSADAAPPTTTD